MKNHHFTAKLEIIGINPFVFIPEDILNHIFEQSERNKSPIPVKGTVNAERIPAKPNEIFRRMALVY
ncbi:hypothetical protein [Chryseobacterium wanjuense]